MTMAFELLVVSVVAFWIITAGRAAGARGVGIALVACLAWLGVTWTIASRVPATFPLVMVGTMILVVLVARSRAGLALSTRVPLAWLVGFQVFRIGVELWLHAGWKAGLVPVQMTFSGLNFDVLTGLTAPIVAVLHARLGRIGVRAWNTMGLLLLATIVTISVLSLPGRHVFAEPNTLVLRVPYIWLPTVLVASAFLGHLLVFRATAASRAPRR